MNTENSPRNESKTIFNSIVKDLSLVLAKTALTERDPEKLSKLASRIATLNRDMEGHLAISGDFSNLELPVADQFPKFQAGYKESKITTTDPILSALLASPTSHKRGYTEKVTIYDTKYKGLSIMEKEADNGHFYYDHFSFVGTNVASATLK